MIKPIAQFILILTLVFFVFPFVVDAVVQLDDTFKPQYSPTVNLVNETQQDPQTFANFVLQMLAGSLIYLAAPIAIVIIAIAGFQAVVSHGNNEILEKAKKTLYRAVIGLLVIIFSYLIIENIVLAILETESQETTANPAQTTPTSPPTSTPAVGGGTGGSGPASGSPDR